MKKLVLMSLLLLATGHVMAIGTCGNCSVFADNDDRKEKTRKEIGLDYSMPDFEMNRIDSKVIGTRLASILQYLKTHDDEFSIKSQLAIILRDQEPDLQYAIIEKFKTKTIRKNGQEINVIIELKIGKNPLGVKRRNITLRFVDGLSDNVAENDLFRYICNYLQ